MLCHKLVWHQSRSLFTTLKINSIRTHGSFKPYRCIHFIVVSKQGQHDVITVRMCAHFIYLFLYFFHDRKHIPVLMMLPRHLLLKA